VAAATPLPDETVEASDVVLLVVVPVVVLLVPAVVPPAELAVLAAVLAV
jgi:hypothetical protein